MFNWLKKLFNTEKEECSYELKKTILCSTLLTIGDNIKDKNTFKSYYKYMCNQTATHGLSYITNNNCILNKFENTSDILYILRNEKNTDKMIDKLVTVVKLKEC